MRVGKEGRKGKGKRWAHGGCCGWLQSWDGSCGGGECVLRAGWGGMVPAGGAPLLHWSVSTWLVAERAWLGVVGCRCYARLHPRAVNCRKKKCGHSNQLR